jgi:hypothetical protein
LRLRLGSTLTIDTSAGPVEIHVRESLDLDTGSSVVTSRAVPSEVLVLVGAPAGKSVSFGAKSAFHGFVYAPEADVHVAADFEVFGGLVCRSLQLAAGAKLHQDLALAAALEPRLPLLHSWRVVELPESVAARRRDPFQVLGLDPRALEPPAEAHEDQALELRYLGTDGNVHTYDGPESAFDWSLVRELLHGLRDGVAFLAPELSGATAAARDPLLALVDSALSSKDLRDALLAAPALSDEVLIAAAQRVPPMSKSDLDNVLDRQPLSDAVLLAAIGSAALDSSALKNVLIDNSPLAPAVLSAVLARLPPLALSDLLNVLAAQ